MQPPVGVQEKLSAKQTDEVCMDHQTPHPAPWRCSTSLQRCAPPSPWGEGFTP